MSEQSNDQDLLDLIAACHENREFSEQRKKELLERLASDPDLRRELAREVQMAALTGTVQKGDSRWLRLEEKMGSEDELETRFQHEEEIMARVEGAGQVSFFGSQWKRDRGSSRWLGLGALAAVLVLSLSIILHGRMTALQFDETSVARVIRIDGEGRTNQGRTLSVGSRLQAGDKLTLEQGLVEMAFIDSGVHVIATAPLELTADSRERIFVHEGEVKLHVPPQGIGFVVETLERKITDLGTSFVVTAREKGSKVLVLDGQIAVEERSGGEENLMFEGELADFDRSGVIKMRSRGHSNVPELTLPSMDLNPASLRGSLIAFESPPSGSIPDDDVIGKRVLPLIRSGFQDQGGLAGLKQIAPLRFTGIAGAYGNFPEVAGLELYENKLGWLAWYSGKRTAPEPGRYRFWGYADNHLLVAVNGKPVFEGSRYSSSLREELGVVRYDHPSLPCLNSAAGFASGEWFELGAESVQLDLLFGEQGGNLTSGLLLVERQGETYEETYWGQPKWPLFLTEVPAESELEELNDLRRHMEEKLIGSFSVSNEAIWKVEQ